MHRTGEKTNKSWHNSMIFCHFAIFYIQFANAIVSNWHLIFTSLLLSESLPNYILAKFENLFLFSDSIPERSLVKPVLMLWKCLRQLRIGNKRQRWNKQLDPQGAILPRLEMVRPKVGSRQCGFSQGLLPPPPFFHLFSREHVGTLLGIMNVALQFAFITNVNSKLNGCLNISTPATLNVGFWLIFQQPDSLEGSQM